MNGIPTRDFILNPFVLSQSKDSENVFRLCYAKREYTRATIYRCSSAGITRSANK